MSSRNPKPPNTQKKLVVLKPKPKVKPKPNSGKKSNRSPEKSKKQRSTDAIIDKSAPGDIGIGSDEEDKPCLDVDGDTDKFGPKDEDEDTPVVTLPTLPLPPQPMPMLDIETGIKDLFDLFAEGNAEEPNPEESETLATLPVTLTILPVTLAVLPVTPATLPVSPWTLPVTQTSAVPWKRYECNWDEDGLPKDEDKIIAHILRKTRGILNKLTSLNVEKRVQEILELRYVQFMEPRIRKVVHLIFGTAIEDSERSAAFAELIRRISEQPTETAMKYQKVIQSYCRMEFPFQRNGISDGGDMNLEARQNRVSQESEERRKRSLGNVRFFGELYKEGMVSLKTIMDCVRMLLATIDDESLDCFCNLLNATGKALVAQLKDFEENLVAMPGQKKQWFWSPEPGFMDRIMSQAKALCENMSVSPRNRFALQDLCELATNDWKPVGIDRKTYWRDHVEEVRLSLVQRKLFSVFPVMMKEPCDTFNLVTKNYEASVIPDDADPSSRKDKSRSRSGTRQPSNAKPAEKEPTGQVPEKNRCKTPIQASTGKNPIQASTGKTPIQASTRGKTPIQASTRGKTQILASTRGKTPIPVNTMGQKLGTNNSSKKNPVPGNLCGKTTGPANSTSGKNTVPAKVNGKKSVPAKPSGKNPVPASTTGTNRVGAQTSSTNMPGTPIVPVPTLPLPSSVPNEETNVYVPLSPEKKSDLPAAFKDNILQSNGLLRSASKVDIQLVRNTKAQTDLGFFEDEDTEDSMINE